MLVLSVRVICPRPGLMGHSILIAKLNYYGIRRKTLDLFSFYFCIGKQVIEIRTLADVEVIQPDTLSIPQYVPQGYIIGSFIFLVCINDISSNVTASLTLYAGNTSACSLAGNGAVLP